MREPLALVGPDPAGIVFNPNFFGFFDWSSALLLEAATGLAKPALLPRARRSLSRRLSPQLFTSGQPPAASGRHASSAGIVRMIR
jgi:hypothetical protein